VADKNLMTLIKSYLNSQIKYESLPMADKNLRTFIRNYLNLKIKDNKKKDKKIKKNRKVIETRRSSTKRVFIGKGELKHSNNKVIITFYVYNTEAMFL